MAKLDRHVEENYDASNEEHVKRAADHAADEDQDLAWVMSTERGRRFLWRLINSREYCHGDYMSFLGSRDDMIFNEGARQVGVHLGKEMVRIERGLYITMIQENLE